MNLINPILPNTIPASKVICGYTTRKGGVSPPPFDSLNLGFKTSDDLFNIQKIVKYYTVTLESTKKMWH